MFQRKHQGSHVACNLVICCSISTAKANGLFMIAFKALVMVPSYTKFVLLPKSCLRRRHGIFPVSSSGLPSSSGSPKFGSLCVARKLLCVVGRRRRRDTGRSRMVQSGAKVPRDFGGWESGMFWWFKMSIQHIWQNCARLRVTVSYCRFFSQHLLVCIFLER